jgi:DNA polymerase-3 subunit epsilon
VAQGTELLGIGRSVYAVFDARLVQHALAHIQRRMARGAQHPHAQFVTHTRAGQLLRVQVAPVRAVAPDGGAHGASPKAPDELAGFVLMLDNITQAFEADAQRDRQVLQWLQTARTLAGRLKLGVDAATAEGAEAWRQSAAELDRVLADALNHYSQQAPVRWPLEDVLGADWLALVAQRLGGTPGLGVRLDEVDGALWLRLDSYAMLQVVQSLVQRLVAEFGIGHVRLRLQAQEGKGALDLVFAGQVMSTETVMTWELDPMVVDGESLPLSVRDVLNRHGAQLWFERDRPRHEAFFRLLLPLASGQAGEAPPPPPAWAQGRPEFYDFDLFQQSPQVAAAEDRPLAELVYTVFDTETTGLNPSGGDEIIQIGATRVVNLKVRRTEVFDQLVDPQRHIPAQTIPIHGITPEMVKGQPTLDQVLPAFHAFAQDSVLVAHNAAFDMKFLSLKQKRLGLVFDHPVLDTLLLASVVFPNQESNRLEALAERFGLTIQGRHTALGDALVTAEVFVRLVPLLADRGIHTMRQAREASQATYLAKLQY